MHLTNFRNHEDSSIEFADGVNFITGPNAQGKTSILEGLSYVCLTKSFLQQPEKSVVRFEADTLCVDASVEKDRGTPHEVKITYERKSGKKYILDGNEVRRAADVVGMFPVVILHPGNLTLTGGGPSDRRKFLDMILSQVSKSYLEESIEYARALKQRNRVLLDGRLTGRLDLGILDAWTDALVAHGAQIVERRSSFVKEFREVFVSAYDWLVKYYETPDMIYMPSFTTGPDIEDTFFAELQRVSMVERSRGATIVGPHRDDLEFTLNGVPVRDFASQGQNKTVLVALKMAEFQCIKTKLAETPVVLLDDVMSELDSFRSASTLRSIAGLGQTFITATDILNAYAGSLNDDRQNSLPDAKVHFVKGGNVLYENV